MNEGWCVPAGNELVGESAAECDLGRCSFATYAYTHTKSLVFRNKGDKAYIHIKTPVYLNGELMAGGAIWIRATLVVGPQLFAGRHCLLCLQDYI